MKQEMTWGPRDPWGDMDAELAALAQDSTLEEMRELAKTFRRWDHQLAVAENVRASRRDAFIILEPYLHMQTKCATPAEITKLRKDLRRWGRQLRRAYGWKLTHRHARKILEDVCGRPGPSN